MKKSKAQIIKNYEKIFYDGELAKELAKILNENELHLFADLFIEYIYLVNKITNKEYEEIIANILRVIYKRRDNATSNQKAE